LQETFMITAKALPDIQISCSKNILILSSGRLAHTVTTEYFKKRQLFTFYITICISEYI